MSRMPPRLTELEPIAEAARAFLQALPAAGFSGDVEAGQAARLVAATDNSVYQVLPQAVVYPRSAEDVVALFRLAAEPRFASVSFAPRGGGTGTNGQALSTGVIVDLSRHMNRILHLDLEGGEVTVEPGVVLDQLNDFLRPHGVFFAPSLSPSTRATLGGMIATDASGQGSRVYGKTSEHVLSLRLVLLGGIPWETAPLAGDALAAALARDDVVGHIHREIVRVADAQRETIDAEWPRLRRFLTGYNLAMMKDHATGMVDLKWLVAGSEGTLATITAATLRLTPLPTARRLLVLGYRTFEDALASARALVEAEPTAIETIDETVLALARADIIYERVRDHLPAAPDGAPLGAINLVEVEGIESAALDQHVAGIVAGLAASEGQAGHPVGWRVAPDEAAREALWDLRKKGVGLLGATPGARKPIPFVEDTVVPPERLAEYVADFRRILDEEGLTYGMFGHIDVGCLHVRPALDLRDPEDEVRLRRISDRVAALVRRYGGLIWGEHGKGFRAEYSPMFFGERLFAACCEIKGAFDPTNRLNPGKVATPPDQREALATLDAPLRGAMDRQVSAAAQARYAVALACNGNGACFHYSGDHIMCPSSKVTRDRVHSPKGRAGVFREWLRQLARAGYDATSAPWGRLRSWLSLPVRAWHSLGRRLGRYDYSHEVADAMAGCLACKACATQCPVKVDVPAFRAELMEQYHRRYLRPLRHHLLARLEGLLPWMARAPRLANLLGGSRPARWLLRRVAGVVDVPRLATRRLSARLRALRVPVVRARDLAGRALSERGVVVLQDAFTSYYRPDVVVAAVELLRALGHEPLVAAYRPNGKGLHVAGFLHRFDRLVRRNAREIEALAATGLPLVGVDPAVTLTYRDEYAHALGRPLAARVELLQEWLARTLSDRPRRLPVAAEARPHAPHRLLLHCTEAALLPSSSRLWGEAFAALGVPLEVIPAGCCGMSGFYGHEARHLAESRGIFAMSWEGHLARAGARALATGYSCQTQAARFAGVELRHPVEVLLAAARDGSEADVDGVAQKAQEVPGLPEAVGEQGREAG